MKRYVKAGRIVTSPATTSTDEMLEAFEDKLAELKGCNDVSARTEVDDDKKVVIYGEDDYERYEDADGIFGERGEVYSFKDIKEYWNNNHDSDPSLEAFGTFEDWWSETSQYMRPAK